MRNAICDLLKRKVEEKSQKFKRQSLEEQSKKRIVASVKANWAVALKNLGDNILESIKNNILSEKEKWFTETLMNDDEIRNLAAEDPRLVKKRKLVKERLKKMLECKDILRY